jgi:hypothetical protein
VRVGAGERRPLAGTAGAKGGSPVWEPPPPHRRHPTVVTSCLPVSCSAPLSQKVFSQRSDRVKSVELHPTEPWCAPPRCCSCSKSVPHRPAGVAAVPCRGGGCSWAGPLRPVLFLLLRCLLPAGSWHLCTMATCTSGTMQSRCVPQAGLAGRRLCGLSVGQQVVLAACSAPPTVGLVMKLCQLA